MVGFGDDDPSDTTDNTVHVPAVRQRSRAGRSERRHRARRRRVVAAGRRRVTLTGPVTIAGGAEGGTVTRTGGSWVADGFVVGQLVMIQGLAGQWRLVGDHRRRH